MVAISNGADFDAVIGAALPGLGLAKSQRKLVRAMQRALQSNPRISGLAPGCTIGNAVASLPASHTKGRSPFANLDVFRLSGGTYQNASGAAFAKTAVISAGDTTGASNVSRWTIRTDETLVYVRVTRAAYGYRFLVDGRYIANEVVYTSASSPGSTTEYFPITMPAGVKDLTVEIQRDCRLSTIYVRDRFSVAYPSVEGPTCMVAISDSYGQGANAEDGNFQTAWGNGFVFQLGDLLGFTHVTSSASGGTGWATTTGGTYGFETRITNGDIAIGATQLPPDLILLQGSINNQATSAGSVQAACLAGLHAVRSQYPGIPIMVLGAFPGASGPSAGLLAAEGAVQAAVTAFADSLCAFIPISTAQVPWISGVGRRIRFTGNLAAATSGTLVTPWTGTTGTYTLLFSDDTSKATVTLTNGSTAVTWSGAVTATAVASATPTGSQGGNSVLYTDQDGIHPPAAGHGLFAAYAANAIRSAYTSMFP